jgi:hypothetical protein
MVVLVVLQHAQEAGGANLLTTSKGKEMTSMVKAH